MATFSEETLATLRQIFAKFDKDGDGKISKEELKQGFAESGESISEEEIAAMLNEGDVDGDGQINFEEFLNLQAA